MRAKEEDGGGAVLRRENRCKVDASNASDSESLVLCQSFLARRKLAWEDGGGVDEREPAEGSV